MKIIRFHFLCSFVTSLIMGICVSPVAITYLFSYLKKLNFILGEVEFWMAYPLAIICLSGFGMYCFKGHWLEKRDQNG